jgi:hypothetical protein
VWCSAAAPAAQQLAAAHAAAAATGTYQVTTGWTQFTVVLCCQAAARCTQSSVHLSMVLVAVCWRQHTPHLQSQYSQMHDLCRSIAGSCRPVVRCEHGKFVLPHCAFAAWGSSSITAMPASKMFWRSLHHSAVCFLIPVALQLHATLLHNHVCQIVLHTAGCNSGKCVCSSVMFWLA